VEVIVETERYKKLNKAFKEIKFTINEFYGFARKMLSKQKEIDEQFKLIENLLEENKPKMKELNLECKAGDHAVISIHGGKCIEEISYVSDSKIYIRIQVDRGTYDEYVFCKKYGVQIDDNYGTYLDWLDDNVMKIVEIR
jgi:hypothetical protein